MSRGEKLAKDFIEIIEEFLKAAGYVKRGGKMVSADDLKADAS